MDYCRAELARQVPFDSEMGLAQSAQYLQLNLPFGYNVVVVHNLSIVPSNFE